MSFMEAVEDLAREAGMPMPARDPREAQKADRRGELPPSWRKPRGISGWR
ncbi:MAG: hypothetical protein R3D61_09650 [Defluviimonas denitrificans]